MVKVIKLEQEIESRKEGLRKRERGILSPERWDGAIRLRKARGVIFEIDTSRVMEFGSSNLLPWGMLSITIWGDCSTYEYTRCKSGRSNVEVFWFKPLDYFFLLIRMEIDRWIRSYKLDKLNWSPSPLIHTRLFFHPQCPAYLSIGCKVWWAWWQFEVAVGVTYAICVTILHSSSILRSLPCSAPWILWIVGFQSNLKLGCIVSKENFRVGL